MTTILENISDQDNTIKRISSHYLYEPKLFGLISEFVCGTKMRMSEKCKIVEDL